MSFLPTLLQTVAESRGNRQVIYPLLDNNLHLLDENLLNLLRAWGNQLKEQASPEETNQLGRLFYSLADVFDEFPRGNPRINLDIAIYGYEFCATTERRQPGLERELATTLTNLGAAYSTQAQLGQEPVANLERAIANHTEAATIRRQPGLERELAGTLTNLGVAYWTQAQLGQEPVANLERAIANHTEAATIRRQPGLERELAT
ncbi:MAG: CHAT domain protein, partial [Microcystis aeruginosa BK11-02]|nr:CHAT domain protein [Microcystis aeruginosa BK11-02]